MRREREEEEEEEMLPILVNRKLSPHGSILLGTKPTIFLSPRGFEYLCDTNNPALRGRPFFRGHVILPP